VRNRVLTTAALVLAAIGGANAASDFLVTPAWLAAHLGKEPIVLLHVGDKAEYDASHIAGAQFITMGDVSDPAATLRLQMASVDRLRTAFEARGISDDSRVIVYFGKDTVTSAARIIVALDYLGLSDRVSMLDGGLPAWRAAGQPVTADVVTPKPGHLSPRPKPDAIVTADWVQNHLADPHVKILDARTPDFFTGERAGNFPRPGHIQGASNIPFDTLTETTTNTFKAPAWLTSQFDAAGVKPGDDVVTYCHIGQQASALYFAARLLGYHVHLYDGSFEEWSANPALPVVKK
jgi:thiosulfate/3-mercaptopyruvate sulfurtransferase